MKSLIYIFNTYDPWLNLAREEYFLNHIEQDTIIFYLWQNANTVVIGRNQNTWKECQIKLLEQDNVKLARRLSGGGAVFHDLGNLNFTFIMPRQIYNLQRQLDVILQAMTSLGLPAKFQGRNDLTIFDKKFSGNAFCMRPNSALHHGTLLVSTDLEKMKYLQVSQEKIRAKGIESVRARVINLTEYQPQLTLADIISALLASFEKEYGQASAKFLDDLSMDTAELNHLYQHYASWDWRFGKAPNFDITLDTRFTWGGIEICLAIKDAYIIAAHIYSDAMDESFISQLRKMLQGQRFTSQELSHNIQQFKWNSEQQVYADDVANWIATKSF